MDWWNARIDAAVAARIAHDLRTVADADAVRHERELALIEAFASAVPEGTAPCDKLDAPGVRRAWLRALLILAMADGELSREEYDLIRTLADARGVPASEVNEGARRVMAAFQGVPNVELPFEPALDTVKRSLDPRVPLEELDLAWN
jgi:hypothetical protein